MLQNNKLDLIPQLCVNFYRNGMNQKRIFYRDLIDHDHVDTDSGDDKIGLMMRLAFSSKSCPICAEICCEYRHLSERKLRPSKGKTIYAFCEPIILICKKCGWWQTNKECNFLDNNLKIRTSTYAHSYHAVIESIDISSDNVIIEDLRRHLLINWNDRKFISPGKAEALVKSLLKEHLSCDVFSATANVNTPDGGIDLLVAHKNGKIQSAVQVKRRIKKNTEPVSEVRNFVGALVIENFKKGIFVTTAERYSAPVKKIPNKLANRLELELMDGNELFEILKCFTKPEELVIPPDVKSDSVWVDEFGNELSTIQVIYDS